MNKRTAVVYDPETLRILTIRTGVFDEARICAKFAPNSVEFYDDFNWHSRYVKRDDHNVIAAAPTSVSFGQAKNTFRKPIGLEPLDVETEPNPHLEQEHIVVARLIGIGDIVMTMPMLSSLRKKYPNAYITYWTSDSGARILYGNRDIDAIKIIDWQHPKTGTPPLPDAIYNSGFDIAINLINRVDFGPQVQTRSRADNFCMVANLEPPKSFEMPELYLTDGQRSFGMDVWKENNLHEGKVIGCFLASHGDCRFWPVDKWLELAKKMKNYQFIWFSDSYEHQLILFPENVINTSNQLNFEEFLAVLAMCDAIVCPDTSGFHLGEMLRIPCLVLEGSTNVSYHTKYYKHVKSVKLWRPLECQPCYDWQKRSDCYQTKDMPWCLTKLSAGRVKRAIEKML